MRRHATSAVETRPRPLRPVYRVEEVLAAVRACLVHPRAEVNVGGSATLLDLLTTVARPLSDLWLATYGVAGQRRPEAAAVPGMLWEASGNGTRPERCRDGAASGTPSGSPRRRRSR